MLVTPIGAPAVPVSAVHLARDVNRLTVSLDVEMSPDVEHEVQVLGVNHRITTPKYRFQLLQTEPVSDRVKGITLKVAIFQGNEPVSNIEKVTFDSTSENMDERTKQVVLVLEDRQFDKKTKYVLRLRDAETDIEQSTVDVIIDRAFSDDF